MKAVVFLCLIAATAVFAEEEIYAETPLSAGIRRIPKIVGGEEAEPHSIPYQVGLFLSGSFCGASLITKRFVLTAAHCGVATPSPQVVLGAHNIRKKEPEQVVLTGKKVINHKNYSSTTLANDIALIELPQDAPLNKNIQIIALAPANGGLYVGQTGQVSGWGLAYQGAQSISPVLRVTTSKIMTNDDCEKGFGGYIPVFDTVICLDGSDKKNACNGDSGGPLVVKANTKSAVQVGLVSYGSSAGCEMGYPVAYTRITKYLTWIKKNSDYKN